MYSTADTELASIPLRYPSKNIGRLHPERMFEQIIKETIIVIAISGHLNPSQPVPHGLHVWGRKCSWNEEHVSRDIEHVSKRGVRV